MSVSSSSWEKLSVGYALPAKKIQSFMQPSLVEHAARRGIHLIPIDPQKSLMEQGPFHCIIHKLYSDDWKKNLEELVSNDSNVIVIDPPSAIEPLRNRISMLQVVADLQLQLQPQNKIPPSHVSFGIPNQVVLYHDEDLESLSSQSDAPIKFPAIAKSLAAEGTGSAHDMLLVFKQQGLNKVKPPVVLQEFVNHRGVVFKVYVAGDYVQCVKRRSLPDVVPADHTNELGTDEGVLFFSQISNLNTCKHKADSHLGGMNVDEAELPPSSFITSMARALQSKLRLHLFNFDMIRDATDPGEEKYLVIDINYFPGYAKMPGFETILTDFLWDVLHRRGGTFA